MNAKAQSKQPKYDEFLGYLRSALHYLYDPVHLRQSPLVALLGLTDEFDKGAALQHLLTRTIQVFKPGENDPPQSVAWRVYDTLSLLYIQQFSRSTVANQLGISERQLRREQRLALEALACHLWDKIVYFPEPVQNQVQEASITAQQQKDLSLNKELEWLSNQEEEPRVQLGEILSTVCDLVQPLAHKMGVTLHTSIQVSVAEIPVIELALRNILLTILSIAIPKAKGNQVAIQAKYQEPNAVIQVACPIPSLELENLFGDIYQEMETAQKLAAFHDAELAIEKQPSGFTISLSFMSMERIPVLVIDDNADWLDMLKRYVVGSRYQVIGMRDSEAAGRTAEKIRPAVIFVDVMLPKMDGWQVLSELRDGQMTGQIPIVVCTVLPLEGLALSLGVDAFLQKPVTQDQFLAMLEKMISLYGWNAKKGLA